MARKTMQDNSVVSLPRGFAYTGDVKESENFTLRLNEELREWVKTRAKAPDRSEAWVIRDAMQFRRAREQQGADMAMNETAESPPPPASGLPKSPVKYPPLKRKKK